jgi:hypothetical protein
MKKSQKKLVLKKETLRNLNDRDLRRVIGGAGTAVLQQQPQEQYVPLWAFSQHNECLTD